MPDPQSHPTNAQPSTPAREDISLTARALRTIFGGLGILAFAYTGLYFMFSSDWIEHTITGFVLLFFILVAVVPMVRSTPWFHLKNITIALGATLTILALYLALFFAGVIQIPRSYWRKIPQKVDRQIMRYIFQTDLPASFKIKKVYWTGTGLLPAPDPRHSYFMAEVAPADFNKLFTGLTPFITPLKNEIRMIGGLMDHALENALIDDIYDDTKKHDWQAVKVTLPNKSDLIGATVFMGWDEKTSQTREVYIEVYPK